MRRLRFRRSSFWLLIPLSAWIISCNNESDIQPDIESRYVRSFPSDVQVAWNDLFLKVERYAAGYRPGPAPRALAYMGLAAYEACIPGMPDYQSLQFICPGLNLPDPNPAFNYHWPSVVHGVYMEMMPLFFPETDPAVQEKWNALIAEWDIRLQEQAGTSYDLSLAYGRAVGEAMWNWSGTDGFGHNAYMDPFGTYDWQAHYNGPGDWIPTSPGPGKAMFPYMGRWRTFAAGQEDKVALPPSSYDMDYSEDPQSEYYAQAAEVYSKNPDTDPLVEWIGEFWSDDIVGLTFSPGPRWMAIALQVIDKENTDLETSLATLAKLGLALNDAVVCAWHSKYLYNVERPETYIRAHIDPGYKTNLFNPLTGEVGLNPSFPGYPSGHATMGAAGAEVLASVFGDAYGMTDRCHQGRTQFQGTPRSFNSFYEMAQENAWSRILLGVHFRMDADEGLRMGTAVARKVNDLPWKK
jgi:hypothetical protein